MFQDYLLGDQLMIFNDIGSDTWQQYIMNYTAIVNDIRDGSFSLWDFSNGLGVNLFNFNLFDPFLMLDDFRGDNPEVKLSDFLTDF